MRAFDSRTDREQRTAEQGVAVAIGGRLADQCDERRPARDPGGFEEHDVGREWAPRSRKNLPELTEARPGAWAPRMREQYERGLSCRRAERRRGWPSLWRVR